MATRSLANAKPRLPRRRPSRGAEAKKTGDHERQEERSIADVYQPKRKHEHPTGGDETDGNAKRPQQHKLEGPWMLRIDMDDDEENNRCPQKT